MVLDPWGIVRNAITHMHTHIHIYVWRLQKDTKRVRISGAKIQKKWEIKRGVCHLQLLLPRQQMQNQKTNVASDKLRFWAKLLVLSQGWRVKNCSEGRFKKKKSYNCSRFLIITRKACTLRVRLNWKHPIRHKDWETTPNQLNPRKEKDDLPEEKLNTLGRVITLSKALNCLYNFSYTFGTQLKKNPGIQKDLIQNWRKKEVI